MLLSIVETVWNTQYIIQLEKKDCSPDHFFFVYLFPDSGLLLATKMEQFEQFATTKAEKATFLGNN